MTGMKGRDAAGKPIGLPCKRFKFTNNILGVGLYGPALDGGQNTMAEFFPELVWDKNLLVGYGEGRASAGLKKNAYPEGTLLEARQTGEGKYGDADWPAVGFVDAAHGDYRLGPTSKYKGMATDGKDLGADMGALPRFATGRADR